MKIVSFFIIRSLWLLIVGLYSDMQLICCGLTWTFKPEIMYAITANFFSNWVFLVFLSANPRVRLFWSFLQVLLIFSCFFIHSEILQIFFLFQYFTPIVFFFIFSTRMLIVPCKRSSILLAEFSSVILEDFILHLMFDPGPVSLEFSLIRQYILIYFFHLSAVGFLFCFCFVFHFLESFIFLTPSVFSFVEGVCLFVLLDKFLF